MTGNGEKRTLLDGPAIVQEVCDDFGWGEQAPGYIDAILWEHTGWPGFFTGDPEVSLRRQVTRYCLLAYAGASGRPT